MAGQLTVDTLRASTGVLATQNGMTGIAKAWVNFQGASGTINGSFNVSSVTRTAAGAYTVNFTTAMANANYSVVLGVNSVTDASFIKLGSSSGAATLTTTSFPLISSNYAATLFDPSSAYVVVLGS
jgi:hypothetical protein